MGEEYKSPEKCENLEDLFDSWRYCWWDSDKYKDETKHKGCFNEDYKGREKWFFPDGFLSNNNKCEILFISKESHEEEAPNNDSNTDFWMRRMVGGSDEYKEKDRSGKGIKYPRYLMYIYNYLQLNMKKEERIKKLSESKGKLSEEKFPMLKNCGYMNLNKHGGRIRKGKHFEDLVIEDVKYIKAQIEIMKPDKIVFLGIKKADYDFMKDIYEKYKVYEVDHPQFAGYEKNIEKLKKQKIQ